ncbi:dermonecrotic toxin domain-containing protein [Pseudomonas synxantha]|uniref:dermonecrotic toxin domain-containing protein n=1 Tax=Pseudomonas synxantha TaxID=47883 RepID=UPI002118F0BB|nr:DUF6543 domain-containing protein [Pseudomonas synxantha]
MIHGNHPSRLSDYTLSPVPLPPVIHKSGKVLEIPPGSHSEASLQTDHDQSLRRSRRDTSVHYETSPGSSSLRSGLSFVPLSPTPAATVSTPQPAADITANTVAHQFAGRPTLRSVVSNLLSDAIKNLYPTLAFDPRYTALAEPISNNPPQYCLTPLLDVALKHLTRDGELDFTDKHSLACTLIDQATGHMLKPGPLAGALVPGIDMQAIELIIRSLRTTLKSGFEQALVRHFNGNAYNTQDIPNLETNRWLWLSDTLRDTLRTAALKQPGLTDTQRETLDQLATYPDQVHRQAAKGNAAAKVFILDTTVSHGASNSAQLSPDLLITREVDGRTQVLHTTPAGVVTPYDSLQAFGEAWGRNLEKVFVFDSLNWKRQEIDTNIFDTQAALILNAMVENVASIELPTSGTPDQLEQAFFRASDPSPWFTGAYAANAAELGRLRDNLPGWLKNASEADRDTYRRHSLALASSVQRNNGRTFLDGIPDIRTYAQQQLDEQLSGKGYTAKDVEVVFKVAVGNLGSGYIERVKMSLVDMALNNLAGLPKGEMEVHLRGQPSSDPQMPQMLKNLISSVDIGRHYPQLLNRELLSETQQSRDRAARFVEQVPIQLAMQALEFKLKGEAGMSAQGYRFIEALTQPGAGSKQVDGQEITVRPLAFVRKPGATPDVVDNMFIIEPVAGTSGPHILYRAQLKPALLEFASRDALLEAIRQPGALQDSVLAWLKDDKVRAVYGNGGFRTPNIARFTVFNEFDPPTTPKPATLAVDGYAEATTLRQDQLNGGLFTHWFRSNANSLVTLAEGQSTSDAESRWASHKELGWLLFNTLLPVLRGPGAMAGWLLQLANSEEDIKRLSTSNDPDPTSAVVDLLINLGMTLGHASSAEPGKPAHTFERFEPDSNPDRPGPGRRDTQEPVVHQAVIRQDPLPPVTTSFGGDGAAIDIRLSSPRGLTPSLLAHIESFKVPAPQHPGSPIAEGSKKGLYQVGDKVYANIDNQWFRTATDLDGTFIIDEQNKSRVAPSIKNDAQGKWRFDVAPKLKGGMENADRATTSFNKAFQAKQQANAAFQRLYAKVGKIAESHTALVTKIEVDIEQYKKARLKLKTLRSLAVTQPERFNEPYRQQLQQTAVLMGNLNQQLRALKTLTHSLVDTSKSAVDAIAPKKIGGIDDITEFQKTRSLEYQYTLQAISKVINLYESLMSDTRIHGVSGASIGDLDQTAMTGSLEAYDELTEAVKKIYLENKQLLETTQVFNSVLERWKSDSPFGKNKAEEFLNHMTGRPLAQHMLINKLNRLAYLKRLTTTWTGLSEGSKHLQMSRLLHENLKTEIVAFTELRNYSGYTLNEQSATLSSVITKFKQVMNDSLLIQEEHPEFFRAEYQQRFIEVLKELIAQTEAELTDVVKEQQVLIPAAPERSARRTKPQNQRVFKTEHQETLIGTLRAPQAGQTVNIIDVVDPTSGQPIASYSEHPGERGWVKIVRGQPVQPPHAFPPKSLASYRSEAQRLIDGLPAIEQTILFQKKKLEDPSRRNTVSPRDWNDMLETQADQLKKIAQQAEASQGAKTETAEWVARWRAAADEMLQKARRHTADGYLVQTPTAENVDYLWRHGFVDINLVRRDIPTKSGDVFTEYAVRKKGKVDVLWYAHFHYPKMGTPRADHTAAHLKIPSQRTKTQKDLIAEAGSNGIVEQIIKSRITPPLDEKLFLQL